MRAVALMSIDDRVLHLPGPIHGMGHCGEMMRDPWKAGPAEDLVDDAEYLCEDCWDKGAEWQRSY